MIRRRYEVRWYAYNLTEPRKRRFFTDIGAGVFQLWLMCANGENSKMYEEIE